MPQVQRICFQLQVRPDRLDDYRDRHERVWPEMLREIEASGRRNYSLFLRSDGLLIGYFETDSLEASNRYLADSTIAERWEAEATAFFIDVEKRPDQSVLHLSEVFNLEDQLNAFEP